MAHDNPEAAHPVAAETLREVQRRYHYGGLRRRVQNYVKNCLICSSVKSNIRQRAAALKPRSPQMPWQTISVDTLGPFIRTLEGYGYVLVIEDLFTKWVEAFPVKTVDARTICRVLEQEIVNRYGSPRTIISDNAKVFTSEPYARFLRGIEAESYLTPVFHQRANSVERRVQELKKIITTLMIKRRDKRQWAKYLTPALRIMRSRKNRATGMSPAKALMGFELPKRGDWYLPTYIKERKAAKYGPKVRRQMIREKQALFNRKNYEQRPLPPRRYRVGDKVMTRETRSGLPEFNPKWYGPCLITEKLSNEVFVVDRDGVPTTFHIDKLRPAPRGNPDPAEIEDSDSGDGGDPTSTDESTTDQEDTAREDEEEQTAGEAPRGSTQSSEPTAGATRLAGTAGQGTQGAEKGNNEDAPPLTGGTPGDEHTDPTCPALDVAKGRETRHPLENRRPPTPSYSNGKRRKRRRDRLIITNPRPGPSGLQSHSRTDDTTLGKQPPGHGIYSSSDSE